MMYNLDSGYKIYLYTVYIVCMYDNNFSEQCTVSNNTSPFILVPTYINSFSLIYQLYFNLHFLILIVCYYGKLRLVKRELSCWLWFLTRRKMCVIKRYSINRNRYCPSINTNNTGIYIFIEKPYIKISILT